MTARMKEEKVQVLRRISSVVLLQTTLVCAKGVDAAARTEQLSNPVCPARSKCTGGGGKVRLAGCFDVKYGTL